MRSKKTLKSFSPKNILATAVALGSCSMSAQAYAAAETVADALASGTAYGDLRLRYETVDQDNALKDASALTLRTRLGYKTAEYSGSSGLVEFEDSRVVAGVDEYNNGIGKNTGV